MLNYFIVILGTLTLSLSVSFLIIIYTISMWNLGRHWERRLKYPANFKKSEEPKVSVIIASYKSASTIRKTVESVMKSDYSNYDILIADDTPDDSVKDALKGLDVVFVRNKERKGKAYSLNKAIKQANAELFLFMDSDSVIDEKFISSLSVWFKDKDVGAASPKFDTRNRHTFIGKMTSLESSFWFTLARMHMYFGSMVSFRGCGVMIRAEALEKVGGWDETLVEDMALAGKLLKNGYKIAHDPRVKVYTEEPETLRGLYRQRFRWGKGGLFAFLRNKEVYFKMRQVTIGMIPHAVLVLILVTLILRNSFMAFLALFPYLNFYITPIPHLFEFLLLLGMLYGAYWIPATFAAVTHTIIFSFKGIKSGREIMLLIPYVLIYMPVLFAIYSLGILAGIKHKIKYGKNANEMNFEDWKLTK